MKSILTFDAASLRYFERPLNKYPIEKLCLFYPALCIPDDVRAGRMMNTKFNPNSIPDTMRCGPMKVGKCYAMDVMDIDSFEEIKTYNGKVCIVHGTADKIVNVNYAKRALEVYRNTTPEAMSEEESVCLHIIEGGTHMFSKKHDVIAMEKLRDFALDVL